MPQFDIAAFNTQLFWFSLIFLTFYFLFNLNYLPYWAYVLKIRAKLTSSKFLVVDNKVLNKHLERSLVGGSI